MDKKNLGVNTTLIVEIFTAIGIIVGISSSENPRMVIIGIPCIIFGILIIAWISVKGRKITRLYYQITADKSVLAVQEAEEIKGRVQVLLDNKPVRNAQLVGLKIWNSGTLTIKPEAYVHNSFTIKFGDGVEILEAKVVKTLPNSIQSEIKLQTDLQNVIIAPPTLYKQNAIFLNVLLTKYHGKVDIESMQLKEGRIIKWDKTLYAQLIKLGVIYYSILLLIFFVSLTIGILILWLLSFVNINFSEPDLFTFYVYLFAISFTIIYIARSILKKYKPDIVPVRV